MKNVSQRELSLVFRSLSIYVFFLSTREYVHISRKNFELDKSVLYCLRGILAILTNCVPTDKWIRIVNRSLANPNDDDAQLANPLNLILFSLIIRQLLGSTILRDNAISSNSIDATSLVDMSLIFLDKWSFTPQDLSDDDDNDNVDASFPSDEPNQVLHLLRSSSIFGEKLDVSQIIIPYIDAKYDRLRLMAVSTLLNIMNYQDFKDLQKTKPNMIQDIIKLTFDYIDQAVAQRTDQYKGIPFERLLHNLLRFLIQDVVKKQAIPYIPKIVTYAKAHNLNALKILRRISSSPDLKEDLINNAELSKFLSEADIIFASNSGMKKILSQIRLNLAPEQQKEFEGKDPNLIHFHCFFFA